MGKTIVHQGGPGAGQHTKMVNQILIATNMIGVCEALLYGYKAGLDLHTVLQIGRQRGGGQLVAEQPRPADHRRQFRSRASSSSTSSRTWGSPWPKPAHGTGPARPGLADQLYLAVKAQGYGRNGTHALELALAKLSGINWKERHSMAKKEENALPV